MKKFEDIHQCTLSKNKIILIAVDKVGITRCGYCARVIDMRPMTEDPEYKREIAKILNT
jgi:hypothetical protein